MARHNRGLWHGAPDVLAQLTRGAAVDPALGYFRTTPVFETGAAPDRWLNKLITIGSGLRRKNAAVLDFYEVA